MKVNRNNYELWMIDYFDGRLNAGEIDELMAFIDSHPDLKEEFELYDDSVLAADEVKYVDKEALKKKQVITVGNISESNYEDQFIAFHENEFGQSDKELVAQFVKRNPHLEKEFILHADLILKADRSVIFTDNESLKRKAAIPVYWWATAAAAAVIILFGIFTLLQQPTSENRRAILSLTKIEAKDFTGSIMDNTEYKLIPGKTIIKPVTITETFSEEEVPETTFRYQLASMPSKNIGVPLIKVSDHALVYESQIPNEDLAYADVSDAPETEKKQGLLSKIVTNYSNRVTARRAEREVKNKDNKDPGFVRFLDQSITVFNTMTGGDTELVKSYDAEGNLKNYQVEGEIISWSKAYSSNTNGE